MKGNCFEAPHILIENCFDCLKITSKLKIWNVCLSVLTDCLSVCLSICLSSCRPLVCLFVSRSVWVLVGWGHSFFELEQSNIQAFLPNRFQFLWLSLIFSKNIENATDIQYFQFWTEDFHICCSAKPLSIFKCICDYNTIHASYWTTIHMINNS